MELSDRIREFHQGDTRDIYVRFATNHPEAPLAHAIAAGVVDKTRVPAELLEYLAGIIEMYEQDLG